jgi:hypothetical protein
MELAQYCVLWQALVLVLNLHDLSPRDLVTDIFVRKI